VCVHGRDEEALEGVRAGIEREGGEAIAVTADITDFPQVEAMRRRVEGELGPIDILVAAAGGNRTPPHDPLEATELTGWHASLAVNLTGTFHVLKSILPGMKERGRGAIVTISSAAARRPTARSPMPYAAAKAGVEMLTRGVAVEAGPSGVRANCIAPETILTETNERLIPEEHRQPLVDAHPLRRLGVPDDVAEAALFLASDRAAWISGIVLDVAGGAVLV
jgi:3-oxoacyl-[acyl-carrier protein] reductase